MKIKKVPARINRPFPLKSSAFRPGSGVSPLAVRFKSDQKEVSPTASRRAYVDVKVPKGECDAQALRELIVEWIAPLLAELYLESSSRS